MENNKKGNTQQVTTTIQFYIHRVSISQLPRTWFISGRDNSIDRHLTSWLVKVDSRKLRGNVVVRTGGEGDDRGWDGWMASPTQWTWVWANSRSWWWTGRLGMLRFMGSQRDRHDWATELNWTELTDGPFQGNNHRESFCGLISSLDSLHEFYESFLYISLFLNPLFLSNCSVHVYTMYGLGWYV